MMKIILASGSPRRRELLSQMDVSFIVVPSEYDEHLDDSRPVEAVAAELALGKAMDVARRFPAACVIGADTIVSAGGKQLGKPADAQEAQSMLRSQSGSVVSVVTGLAVVHLEGGFKKVLADTADVHFKPYDPRAIAKYIASGDPLDKAGAFGVQSGAAPLISHIKGHYDTIVGLPTYLLAPILTELGINARPVELVASVPQAA